MKHIFLLACFSALIMVGSATIQDWLKKNCTSPDHSTSPQCANSTGVRCHTNIPTVDLNHHPNRVAIVFLCIAGVIFFGAPIDDE